MKKTQKFWHGDLVRVADDLGSHMSHFESGCDAIVQYSYADMYGGDDISSYSLLFKNGNSSSWYEENQLTLLKENQRGLLKKWVNNKRNEVLK